MSIYVDIRRRVGEFQLDVAFEAGRETLALLGDSGCGKSMTLRCIAGVLRPNEGVIRIDGETVFDSARRIDRRPQRRRVGYLFQNYALFPNMTVTENIMTGLERERGLSRAQRRAAAGLSRTLSFIYIITIAKGHYNLIFKQNHARINL